ncbi:MAG: DUF5658 family protein [Pirellula staleyi]
MNPYKILGIREQATEEEIKRAYRAMAAKYHPDVGGDAWVFEQVGEAYDRINQSRQAAKAGKPPTTANSSAAKPKQPKPESVSPRQPNASSKNESHPQTASTNRPGTLSQPASFFKRVINLLFYRQLPLQSETSYFIFINVLDIIFTNALLRSGAIEANPLANYFLKHGGFPGMIAFKLVLVAGTCLVTQLIAVHHLNRAKQVLYIGCGMVGLVVGYSALLLMRKLA